MNRVALPLLGGPVAVVCIVLCSAGHDPAEPSERAENVRFSVAPGDVAVARGGRLRIEARVSRVTAFPVVKFQTAEGEWRTLPMSEDSQRAEHFVVTLPALSEDTTYRVVMGAHGSPFYRARVREFATCSFEIAR